MPEGEVMKAGAIRWLVLATGISVLAGCQQSQSAATKISLAPPRQPFVFYDETGEASARAVALSEAELREIIDWVATQTSDPVWLIRVRPDVGKVRNRMVAYIVPEEATPRARVGRAYDIPGSKRQAALRSPWKYIQVSLPGHRFDAQLTKPSVREMPFYFPDVTDPNSGTSCLVPQEDVIAVLDFVRHRSNDIPIVGTLLGHTIGRRGPDLPVAEIKGEGERIEVMFGYVHGRLWGHGVNVEVKRTRNGYKVVGWSNWIS
jgi:hypothetical protein